MRILAPKESKPAPQHYKSVPLNIDKDTIFVMDSHNISNRGFAKLLNTFNAELKLGSL